jgi:hypothetical protein
MIIKEKSLRISIICMIIIMNISLYFEKFTYQTRVGYSNWMAMAQLVNILYYPNNTKNITYYHIKQLKRPVSR